MPPIPPPRINTSNMFYRNKKTGNPIKLTKQEYNKGLNELINYMKTNGLDEVHSKHFDNINKDKSISKTLKKFVNTLCTNNNYSDVRRMKKEGMLNNFAVTFEDLITLRDGKGNEKKDISVKQFLIRNKMIHKNITNEEYSKGLKDLLDYLKDDKEVKDNDNHISRDKLVQIARDKVLSNPAQIIALSLIEYSTYNTARNVQEEGFFPDKNLSMRDLYALQRETGFDGEDISREINNFKSKIDWADEKVE